MIKEMTREEKFAFLHMFIFYHTFCVGYLHKVPTQFSCGQPVMVFRSTSSSNRTLEKWEENQGLVKGVLMKGQSQEESGSLKKLSLRWLILSGGTTTPGEVCTLVRGRLESILAFSRFKDLPSLKLCFKMEDSPAY